MMRHAGVHIPVWLNEGTAEVYSTTELRGGEVRIGELIAVHLATLRSEAMLPLDVLASVDHDSPLYNERDKSGIFYAQSWALAHMLNFSSQYQPGMPNLIAMLATGEEPARAFQQAFGKSLAAVQRDLDAYVHQARFAGVRFRAPKLEARPRAEAVPVSEVAATLALCDLLVSIRRPAAADTLLESVAAKNPQDAEIQAALGDAAIRRDEDEKARQHYERAMELGNTTGRVRHDYALVLRQLRRPNDEVVKWLREAVSLDPNLFDAHYVLGYLALEAGRLVEAAESLKRATELRPLRAAVWEHLALAYHHGGRKADARAAARRARLLAVGSEEIARIEGTQRLVESEPEKIVRLAPQPQPPEGERFARRTHGEAVEGSLIQVDCLREKARLHVVHGAGKLLLLVRDPSAVVLRNAGAVWTEFACGPVARRAVHVEYRRQDDRRYGTAGEVTAIEFR
jgi:Tfp pilus assembly protein PilF